MNVLQRTFVSGVAALLLAIVYIVIGPSLGPALRDQNATGWVQAIGALLAIGAAAWIASWQHRAALQKENREQRAAMVRRAEGLLNVMRPAAGALQALAMLTADGWALEEGIVRSCLVSLSSVADALARMDVLAFEDPAIVSNYLQADAAVRGALHVLENVLARDGRSRAACAAAYPPTFADRGEMVARSVQAVGMIVDDMLAGIDWRSSRI